MSNPNFCLQLGIWTYATSMIACFAGEVYSSPGKLTRAPGRRLWIDFQDGQYIARSDE